MIGKYKNNKLVKNFFSLSALQMVNYILPLITIPYLVRVIGPEKFGLLAFSTALITYFSIIVDYGFNLSATKEISINRDNRSKVVEIFSSVMTIKFILLIFSFVVLTIIVFSFDKFYQNYMIYYFTFGIAIGQMLFPIWLFQGLEDMKYITFINIFTKSIFTLAIFLFIKEESDFYLVPIFNSLGFIISGTIALYIIKNKFYISFKFQKFQIIKKYLKDSWYIFISNMAVSLYTVTTVFILGLFASNTVVSYYSAAEKIVKAVQSLLEPLAQAIFPHIGKISNNSKIKAIIFIRRITFYVGIFTFMMSCLLFFFAKDITLIILGDRFIESIKVIQILSFLPFMIGLSKIFGVQTMLNFNRQKAFSKILIFSSILNIILALIFVPMYHHIGSAYVVLFVETLVTISMFIYLQSSGLKIIGKNKNVC